MGYIDQQEFWDGSALAKDAERVFDICNGCRRCFNLCPSFDVLFKRIDASDGEVTALKPETLKETADLCYYCKLCYNHCPYCPPHAYALDFPRLMVRAKAQQARRSGPRLRDRLLANTVLIGRLGGRFAPIANWAARVRPLRILAEWLVGIHRDRNLPRFAFRSFARWFADDAGAATGGAGGRRLRESTGAPSTSVVLFYTCYVNHHDPEIGRASVQVLQQNGLQVTCPEQDCCGMPYFDTGEVDKIVALARRNIDRLLPYVEQGCKIVVPMPTCSLMLKKEYPELLGDEASRRVAAATLDLSEYLMQLEAAGRLSKAFKAMQARVLYQVPCHLRDQNIGYKARDLLRLIPGVTVEVVERCSGHDGSFGVKQEYYQISLQIGRKAFDAVEKTQPDRVVTDCPLSALQLEQATGRPASHPIQLVKEAYGIKP